LSPWCALSLFLLFSVVACAQEEISMTNDTHQVTQQNDQTGDFIGFARMEADGTLVLRLDAYLDNSETAAHGYFRYSPDHPRYEETLLHVGPIKPGEEKLVRPWPETSR
jgi:hypothetical protein